MPLKSIQILFLALMCNLALAAEPPGLRDAMAKYDNAQIELRNKLYGARIPNVDPSNYQFKYALVDLDGDGIQDAVVYFTDKTSCGTGGCAMRIMKGIKDGFTFVSGTLRVFLPIQVLAQDSHGWKSLAVKLRNGDAGVLNFDGRRYPLSPPDGHPASNSELVGAVTLIAQ